MLRERILRHCRRLASRARRTIVVSFAAFSLCAAPLFATHASAQSIPPPPVRSFVDGNGVDLVSGILRWPGHSIAIGLQGQGGLVYTRQYDSSVPAWRDNYAGEINATGSDYTVTILGGSTRFTLTGGVFVQAEGDGSTLTFDGTNTYTFTSAAGDVAIYSKTLAGTSPTQANEGRITSLTSPSGEVLTFTYVTLNSTTQRLQSVANNFGYLGCCRFHRRPVKVFKAEFGERDRDKALCAMRPQFLRAFPGSLEIGSRHWRWRQDRRH
jgi:hypothetical protein